MSFTPSALYDAAGNPIGSLNDPDMGRMLATVTQSKGWALADGLLSNYAVLRGFGYDAGVTSTLKDINGYAGNVLKPASAIDMPIKFPARCDVKISSAVLGAGTGECGVGFEFWLEH